MTRTEFRDLLQTIGWSERELAARLGAHRNTVNDWANDRRKPPQIVLEWLASLAVAHEARPAPEWRVAGS